MVARLQILALALLCGFLGALIPQRVEAGAFAPARTTNECVEKSADESCSSDTTLNNDTHLLYAVAASTTYRYRFTAHWYSSAAAGGFKFEVTAPSSPTFLQGSMSLITDATAFTAFTNNVATANIASECSASNAFGTVIVDGVLINGGNTGNLRLTWCQQTSSGTATVLKKGSTLEVWTI